MRRYGSRVCLGPCVAGLFAAAAAAAETDFQRTIEDAAATAAFEDGLKAQFDSFDRNGDGVVSADEASAVSHSCTRNGQPIACPAGMSWLKSHDLDGDGRVSFAEFRRVALQARHITQQAGKPL